MSIVWLFSYLADSVFLVLYFRRSTYAPGRQHFWLKPVLLLLSLPLYLNTTLLPIPSAAVRIFLRIAIYFLWCFGTEGVPWKPSLYAALFWAAAYTLFQNLFFGPILRDIFMESTDLIPSHTANQALLSLITVLLRILYFGAIAKILPFPGMGAAELPNIFLAGVICFAAAYIKSTGTPILSEFSSAPAAFTTYYMIMHLALLLVLISAELVRRKDVESASLAVQNTAANALLTSIQDRQNSEESIRALRHDLKNHTISLQLLLEQGKTEDALAYLKTIREEASDPTGSFHTGSDLLNGLLKQKLSPAQNDGIRTEVSLDFTSGTFVDNFDLCVLMGNVLDNAVEACERVSPQEDRFIRISGGKSANCLLIRVENSFSGVPVQENSLPTTSKKDKMLHGFGLRNVKRVLGKYNGTLTISTEEGCFAAGMLIPIPEEEDP